ncbi:MAG: hypothetical protein ABI747_02425 [Candidatus Moraniibacteriota bacterium]
MKKTEKVAFFRKKLLDFLEKSGREHLPWRKKRITPYEVWVSEVMLQQTQVSRVIGYYEKFLARFPTVEKLSQATWEEFLPYYAGLGYYSRGRNMLKTAQAVMKKHKGKFPKELPELVKLPGIGPYTARAVASFALGAPHLAWDTNLKRVFGRVFRGGKELLTEEDKILFEENLGKDAPRLNAALMDFGSSLCLSRPKCEACMLQSICTYYREGGKKEKKPVKKKRRHFPLDEAEVVVYLHENHKKYYSSHPKKFVPFHLPAGFADRAGIKEYFKKKFGLELAVRPPSAQAYLRKEPVLLVNAQVLLGTPSFSVFPKSAALEYNKSNIILLS